MVYKVNKLGYKCTLNGVAFSCSNARVNHNELRIMFGFLMPSYSPDACLSNCTVSHSSKANVTAVRRSDLNHKQTMTPSGLFTDTLTFKLPKHTTIRYLNLQSHIDQILAEISRTCWVSYKMRSGVLKVVIMTLLVTLVQLL